MARKPKLSYESRIELAKEKIHEKPDRALNEIGKFLTKEIKNATKRSKKKRFIKTKSGELKEIKPGRLRKSIGYWKRKREGDLLIGSKAFYAPIIEMGTHDGHYKDPFLLPTIKQNISVIKDMTAEVLKELNKG